jgi:hypothetical protein
MSWAGLANNQIVSNANLDNAISTAVFVRRATFSDSNQELTKARAQSYVYLNENLSSLFNKTNNQLVAKQDLQAATFIACGSGTYGNIVWTANRAEYSTVFFDVGTTSGTLTIDYQVNSGSASLLAVYGTNTLSITGIVNSNGSTTYSYTYNPSIGTILGITFSTRQNPAVTQNFNVRTSCAATTTTSTTTSTTTLFENLFFDASVGIGGYTITAIDVNGVTPTLVSGTNVPFNTDGHGFNTTQTGNNETLNLAITVVVNGCITVTDSASNVYQQNINSSGNYAFTGLVINNTTAVQVLMADNAC